MNPSHILIWNVRGLNSVARRNVVRSLVVSTKIDIVCLQETKMVAISREIILSMLGSDFDNNYICLPSVGASGGILIAWRSRLDAIQASRKDNHSAQFSFAQLVAALGGSLVCMVPKTIKRSCNFCKSSETFGFSALGPGWSQGISILSTETKTKTMVI